MDQIEGITKILVWDERNTYISSLLATTVGAILVAITLIQKSSKVIKSNVRQILNETQLYM